MTVNNVGSTHPEYDYHAVDWRQMRDTYAGQRAVKARSTYYLPATSGMIADGMGKVSYQDPATGAYMLNTQGSAGQQAYDAYLKRALFHAFVKDAVQTMLGMLWNKPAVYELPARMEYLRTRASTDGDGLQQLHRRIHEQQLVTGRLGLLADMNSTNDGQPAGNPYLGMYKAEQIITWDAGFRGELPVETVNMVVLDESGPRRVDLFQYEQYTQHRVLLLGPGETNERYGTYTMGEFGQSAGGPGIPFDESQMRAPVFLNRKTLDFIPFTFVTANSTTDKICQPPLMGLSDLDLALYRLEADYRLALYQQTQDTLFTKGFTKNPNEALRIGVGGNIHAVQPKADAKFVGVQSKGLPEMRNAIENDTKAAASKAGELMDPSSRARESGHALEMRIGSKTATMNEIAISAAEGLQKALRYIGVMNNVPDSEIEKIVVAPNMRFTSMEFSSLELMNLVDAKTNGAPVSFRSMHKWAVDRGFTTLSFEDMVAEIKNEIDLNKQVKPLTEKEKLQADQEDRALDIKDKVASKPTPAPAVAPASGQNTQEEE